MKFTKKQIDRYSRQIILKKVGVVGQKKLLKSSVLIVGVGGLGSPFAIYLAALCICNIGIVDNDKIDLSNLHRQILFDKRDVKKNKIQVAKTKLNRIGKPVDIANAAVFLGSDLSSYITGQVINLNGGMLM